jgi:O-acetyl-ADP-ribose deacetylase (regulator of RNase III)
VLALLVKEQQNDWIYDSNAEAIVNTVNCVGIMGCGIAYSYTEERKEIHFSLHPAVAHKRKH